MKSRLHIKLDDDVKDLLAVAAKSERKTITAFLTPLIFRELKRLGLYKPGAPRKPTKVEPT